MNTGEQDKLGGIVLCGGRSSRMGRSKLFLSFGSELMLLRVIRIMEQVVSPVVVVAGPRQAVPPLPADVCILRDEEEHLGPLAGLAIGLKALQGTVDAAYVSACDAPLLQPGFVRFLARQLQKHDLVLPHDGRYFYALSAVYRPHLAEAASALIAAGRMRPVFLMESCDARVVSTQELIEVDAALHSLRNVNTPEDYRTALALAGLAPQCSDPNGQP